MTSRRTRERLVARLREQGIRSPAVLEVMANTPRHLFLDEALAHRAYEDSALPIGFGQTLSQPYIVARMTELLLAAGRPLKKVLEIGTGSGYQTAVLAQLVGELYSVERIRALQERAAQRLRQLNIRNVVMRHADGTHGWQTQAPFDAILVAAAPVLIPDDLIEQLAPAGVLVMPVGDAQQNLCVFTRSADGTVERKNIEPVRFVPLLPGVEG